MIDMYSILGWIGMVLILTAYLLISIKKIKSDSYYYQILNLFGAIGIVISTLFTKSWPAMTLNIIWAIIAGFSIIKIMPKNK